MTNKYAEGYPGQALLWRLPVRRHRRDTRHRARQEAVRLQLRQRAAQFRQPDEPGRVPGAAAAGRHLHGPRPQFGRPPDPRLAGQHVRQVVQRRLLRRAPRRPPARHGRGRDAGARAQAQADPRRRHRLFAHLGLEALPRDRRCGRRLPDGRHGAYRRPRRRRRASLAAPACPCRHHDHAQVAARPARRHDPHQRRGDRQEDQLGRLPGPAGRPADACHRRQGRGLRRGAAARVQGLCQAGRRQRQGAGRER